MGRKNTRGEFAVKTTLLSRRKDGRVKFMVYVSSRGVDAKMDDLKTLFRSFFSNLSL